MQIVTVTDSFDKLRTILTSKIEDVWGIEEYINPRDSDWDVMDKRPFRNTTFYIKLTKSKTIMVMGDIDVFLNLCNTGGSLPSTSNEFNTLTRDQGM